jgi:hypothetical protein
MSGIRVSRRLVVAFIFTSAMVFLTLPSSVGAAGTASITIHARQCPVGEPTTDIFADCHGFPADPITTFRLNGHGAKTINDRGNLKYSNLTAGTRTITLVSDNQPFEFLHLRVYCSVPSTGAPAVEKTVQINDQQQAYFRYALKAGQQVVCDVYFIPESGQ